MQQLTILPERCTRCGRCQRVCPVKLFSVDPLRATVPRENAGEACIACGHCVAACPTGAIQLNGVRADTLESANGPLPGFDEIRRLVVRRRSVRLYQQRVVPRAEIERILDAVRWSPTAVNNQQVSWTVVMQPDRVKEIAGQVVDFVRLKGDRNGLVKAWDNGFDAVMRGAPHLVVAHGPASLPWSKTDCVIATTLFDTLARAAGLGTCWAGYLLWAAAEHRPIAEGLGIPDDHVLHGALMLGYPLAAFLRVPTRNPLAATWLE